MRSEAPERTKMCAAGGIGSPVRSDILERNIHWRITIEGVGKHLPRIEVTDESQIISYGGGIRPLSRTPLMDAIPRIEWNRGPSVSYAPVIDLTEERERRAFYRYYRRPRSSTTPPSNPAPGASSSGPTPASSTPSGTPTGIFPPGDALAALPADVQQTFWCIQTRESKHEPTVVNSSSGDGGLYQFAVGTWDANGGGAYASNAQYATVAEQDQVAYNTYIHYGWTPWNGDCGI